MRLHALRHVPYEGLGHVAEWADARGHEVAVTRCWEHGAFPDPDTYDLLVVLGGPMGVRDAGRYSWLARELDYLERIVEIGRPVVGICLGGQMLAAVLGAAVARHRHPEVGWHRIEPATGGAGSGEEALLAPFFAPGVRVLQWHYDAFTLPAGARALARSEACERQAFSWGERLLALQFHPEMTAAEVDAILQQDGVPAPGRYTQGPAELRDPDRFERLREAAFAFLDRLAIAWGL